MYDHGSGVSDKTSTATSSLPHMSASVLCRQLCWRSHPYSLDAVIAPVIARTIRTGSPFWMRTGTPAGCRPKFDGLTAVRRASKNRSCTNKEGKGGGGAGCVTPENEAKVSPPSWPRCQTLVTKQALVVITHKPQTVHTCTVRFVFGPTTAGVQDLPPCTK